jgi:hypothetical protein
LDLLSIWHAKIETWILNEAGFVTDASAMRFDRFEGNAALSSHGALA